MANGNNDLVILAGGGVLAFFAWRYYEDHKLSSTLPNYVMPLPDVPVNYQPPQTAPVITPPTAITPPPIAATPTPVVTAPVPVGPTVADQNAAYQTQEDNAAAVQKSYFDNYLAQQQAAVSSGALVAGTPEYAAQERYLNAQGLSLA